MTDRIEELEGQLNALSEAWLLLATELETAGVIDAPRLDVRMSNTHWPDGPLAPIAKETLEWLRQEWAYRRARRRLASQAQALDDGRQ